MFMSRKKLLDESRESAYRALSGALPHIDQLALKFRGIRVRGLSINPARQGDGYLAILKLTLDDTDELVELVGGAEAGHYVVYGHGPEVLEALAALEAQLELGIASLVREKYA